MEKEAVAVSVDSVSSVVLNGQCELWQVFMEQVRAKSRGEDAAVMGLEGTQAVAIEETLDGLSRVQGGLLRTGAGQGFADEVKEKG